MVKEAAMAKLLASEVYIYTYTHMYAYMYTYTHTIIIQIYLYLHTYLYKINTSISTHTCQRSTSHTLQAPPPCYQNTQVR